MQVTIFGATGMVGKQLMIHALAKGWKVNAFGRNVDSLIDEDLRSEQLHSIKGYVFDEGDVRKALQGSDAVLSALGGAFDGSDKARSLGIKNIIAQMKATGIRRIVALGGLGVLPNENGHYVMDAPDYPQEYVPVGQEHKQAYEHLKSSGLDWTFVCAPNILPKEADNHFMALEEHMPSSWEINAGNLALLMVQEIAFPQYLHHRVGISNIVGE